MSKEAMKLALEALETSMYPQQKQLQAITALREALANEALDRMAENARELGLDYEPAQQEPVAMHEDWYDSNSCGHCGMVGGHAKTCRHYTSPPAQRTWVGLTDEERKLLRNSVGYNQFVTAGEYAEHVQKATEFRLLEKNR